MDPGAQLDQIPWGELSHAHGQALDVPGWLSALRDLERARPALVCLYDALLNDGRIFPASVAAAPLLVRQAESSATRVAALSLLVDMADAPAGDPGLLVRLRGHLAEGAGVFRGLLDHDDASVRRNALLCMACCPPEPDTQDAVGALLDREPHYSMRCTAALVLGHLGRAPDLHDDHSLAAFARHVAAAAAGQRVGAALVAFPVDHTDWLAAAWRRVRGSALMDVVQLAARTEPARVLPYLARSMGAFDEGHAFGPPLAASIVRLALPAPALLAALESWQRDVLSALVTAPACWSGPDAVQALTGRVAGLEPGDARGRLAARLGVDPAVQTVPTQRSTGRVLDAAQRQLVRAVHDALRRTRFQLDDGWQAFLDGGYELDPAPSARLVARAELTMALFLGLPGRPEALPHLALRVQEPGGFAVLRLVLGDAEAAVALVAGLAGRLGLDNVAGELVPRALQVCPQLLIDRGDGSVAVVERS